MDRYVAPVAYIPKGDRGYWFVLFNGQRIFCHISNYSEIDVPPVGKLLSFSLTTGHHPELGPQAINIRPATKEELNTRVGINALAGGAA
jgi:hypothetical protein